VTFQAGISGFYRFAEAVGLPLEPFQRRIARTVLGATESLVLLPRGNGKSCLIAALAVHHLLTERRAAVYVAASSREQASVVFAYARDFARHPAVSEHLTVRHLELRTPDGGQLRVLASDAPKLHGLTPSLCVIDELHAHASDEVYLSLRTALAKRPGARMVTITTAGHGADSPLGKLRRRALASPTIERKGALTIAPGGTVDMLEWAVPEKLPLTTAKRANPASWLTAAALEAQRAALPEAAFRRYHCGQWVQTESPIFPAGAWQACVDQNGSGLIEPGARIWVGIDAGKGLSDTAIVWCDAELNVGCEILEGERAVSDITDVIDELARTYEVAELVCDPWHVAGALSQAWEARGLLVVEWPQFESRLIPASRRLHEAVAEGRLRHPDDPILNSHVEGSIARQTRRGWRVDKAKGRKNDGVIALLMALDRAEQTPSTVEVLAWIG
jgi:phage terminase large subunit-like protein